MASSPAPTALLRHGVAMPMFGLGTYPMDDAECERSIPTAVDVGYRLFDTAENYGNEVGVGRGIKASGIPREEVFVCSKFNAQWHGRALVVEACQRSLDRLGLDYLDLFLIHWPNPKQDQYVDAWLGLCDLFEQGLLKAIGTSNFMPVHLDRIIAESDVVPHVNQIQMSPVVARKVQRDYDVAHAIATQSWSPLGGNGPNVLDNETINRIATKHGRTAAQIALRWHVEVGSTPIAKTSEPTRMAENLAVFDFALSDDDLAAIAAIDLGEGAHFDPEEFGN